MVFIKKRLILSYYFLLTQVKVIWILTEVDFHDLIEVIVIPVMLLGYSRQDIYPFRLVNSLGPSKGLGTKWAFLLLFYVALDQFFPLI